MTNRLLACSSSDHQPEWDVRSGAALLSYLLLLFLLWGSANAQPQAGSGNPPNDDQNRLPLNLGEPVERAIASGATHAYQLTLAAGQYIFVSAEQHGSELVVVLLDPTGRRLVSSDDTNGSYGVKTVTWVTETDGVYRLDVHVSDKNAATGRYELKLLALRAATSDDRALHEAARLNDEAVSLYGKAKYAEAITLAERALNIRERVVGPENTLVAQTLNNLAESYQAKGDYTKTEVYFQRALQIRETKLGREHPEVAQSLSNLASLYRTQGAYAKAEPLYQRALAIREKTLGPAHQDVAHSLNGLAVMYYGTGDYAKAAPLLERAFEIREKVLGPEHPETALSLHNLAGLYYILGEYEKAEPLCRHALTIREKVLGMEHPDTSLSLNLLALLYYNEGDYASAEPLYQRALEIWEKTRGPEHPDTATAIQNLANLYSRKKEYAKAVPLFQRALTIFENKLGPAHPNVATTMNNLARVYRESGDYARADSLYQRALMLREKALGPEHQEIANSLVNLAVLYSRMRDFAKAEAFYERALPIFEKAVGPYHPEYAETLYNLASLHLVRNNVSQAIALLSLANEAREHHISRILGVGSERQKLAYLNLFSGELNSTLSLHAQYAPENNEALKLALTTLLRRKGRGLDATADTISMACQQASETEQNLFEQLSLARAQFASLTLKGAGAAKPGAYRAQLKQLEEQIDKLEAEISQHSKAFRAQSQPITLEAVRAAIPNEAALIEFALYTPYDVKANASGVPHYAAYVLTPQAAPRWVELGEADAIDRAVTALRQALRDPKNASVKRLARALDEKLMRPVRPLLGDARLLLVSPDGALNLVPFAAMVDEQRHYLVERYSFTYLTSGRDLLRLQIPREKLQSAPLILANPDFGFRTKAESSAPAPANQQAAEAQGEFARLFVPALAGAAQEGDDLKALLPRARLLTGAQATETALKQANAPEILHVATHGFFLQDRAPLDESRRSLSVGLSNTSERWSGNWVAKIENPLLRSGLALAKFNQHPGGTDDGALTALEAAGLNLWGTKLVVLSACDTGVGEIRNGEGVYGLRRALVLAGAETQLMSLWAVQDIQTRLLIVGYYQRLLQGDGRGAALRSIQLDMLRQGKLKHPHYWASFIQAGEWGNLDGKR